MQICSNQGKLTSEGGKNRFRLLHMATLPGLRVCSSPLFLRFPQTSKPVRRTRCAWTEDQEFRSRVFVLEGRDVGNVPVDVDTNEVITKVELI